MRRTWWSAAAVAWIWLPGSVALAQPGAGDPAATGPNPYDEEPVELPGSPGPAADSGTDGTPPVSEEEAGLERGDDGDGISDGDYEDEGDAYDDEEDFEEEFEPDEGLQEYVSVSTKFTYPVQQTPANVYVVTREQIEAAGYQSVGEALSWVPGLFVSYDLLNYHVGARGLFGGSRSGSRLFRILINGRHAAFVQAETYLLGPEFIPVSAIERIEVMLGPASSLYGAGALVGAINIVTRRPAYEGRVVVAGDVRANGAVGGELAGGFDGTLSATGASWFVLGSAGLLWEDRSGLTAPLLSGRGAPPPQQSRNDSTRLRSFFLRGEARVLGGLFFAQSFLQVSDRAAEFYDISLLSGRTRLDLRNTNVAVGWERPFGSGWQFRIGFGIAEASPGAEDVFDPDPDDGLVVRREFSTLETSGRVEVLKEFANRGLLLVGADFRYTMDQPQQVNELLGGSLTFGPKPDPQVIYSIAGYVQLVYPVADTVTLAGAARYDHHSIEPSFSGRAAVLYRPTDRLTLKLMGGRSFKAPSPEQLYNNPLSDLDIRGDETLGAQHLNTAQLAADWFPSRNVRLAGTFFFNVTQRALAYLARGGQLQATSFDAQSLGGELLARYAHTPEDGIGYGFGASTSLQQTRTSEGLEGGFIEKDVPDNEAYPQVMATVYGNLRLPSAYTSLHAAWRYVGTRVPSQSNLRAQGTTDMRFPGYLLPAYHMVRLSASFGPVDLGSDAKLKLRLVLDDALDQRPVAIGFNGVDVPAVGRTLWGSLLVQF